MYNPYVARSDSTIFLKILSPKILPTVTPFWVTFWIPLTARKTANVSALSLPGFVVFVVRRNFGDTH
jgi:hypothetical protein